MGACHDSSYLGRRLVLLLRLASRLSNELDVWPAGAESLVEFGTDGTVEEVGGEVLEDCILSQMVRDMLKRDSWERGLDGTNL
jgi:hypothetical protein